jgi:hypothetical protein
MLFPAPVASSPSFWVCFENISFGSVPPVGPPNKHDNFRLSCSYSPTVLRSVRERIFASPSGAPPGYGRRSCAAWHRGGGLWWASDRRGGGPRAHTAAAAERAERRARLSASPPRRQAAVFRPACALAWAHEVASVTNLGVRARAGVVVCGAWRAVVAAARRLRATIGFGVPAGPRSEPFGGRRTFTVT